MGRFRSSILIAFALPVAWVQQANAGAYMVSPFTPPEIAEFLRLPDTRVFEADPVEWKWSVERLRKGQPIPGGCRYEESGTFSQLLQGAKQVVSVEVAVNPRICQTLVIEGEPVAS
jgi:hypothetical protein